MNKWFRIQLSSLRTKLMVMFIGLTLIPMIAIGLISYLKSFDTIADHSKAASMYIADELARSIDIHFQDTRRLLELENNSTVLQFLFRQTDSYTDAKQILQTFELYRKTYTYEHVLNISMVNLYGRGISERKGVFSLNQNPLRNPHFAHLLNHPDDVLIVPPSDASPMDRLDGYQYPAGGVITVISTIKQRITNEVIGFIVIDLDDSFVRHFVEHATFGKTGNFIVTDASGQPIYQPENAIHEMPLAGSQDQLSRSKDTIIARSKNKGGQMFITYTTSQETGWKIIGIAPLNEIFEDAYEIRRLIFVSVGLSILFIFILYFFMTTRLIKPIHVLMRKMRQASSGNLNARVNPSGSDEIADLGKCFNMMTEQIKELMEKSIREQRTLRMAELRTLQAQINPHFLYNTLDSIIWMAEAGKNDQVIHLIQALSRFYRISLSKGRDLITLREELEHVHNYLMIQQVRYRDILDYSIDVPEDILSNFILKMTLQPIVENAIYHGIKNKRGKGLIRITGRVEGHVLYITVSDNGAGMSPETVKMLTRRIQAAAYQEPGGDMWNEKKNGSYGLYNVEQRIRLYFGSEYGTTIQSREGIGTDIIVRIPVHTGGIRHEETYLSG
jgi:two-component system sensor histidine kinase YesM